MTALQLRLMDFYDVDTLEKLIEKQAEHILSLQQKLSIYEVNKSSAIFKPERVRC